MALNAAAAERRRVQRLLVDRALAGGFRSVTARSRRIEGGNDAMQMRSRAASTLRVMATAENGGPAGAVTEDIGKLIFVPGYSKVGGGDFIPDA